MTNPEPNLLLIGLRGSGKSTLARALASHQGRKCIDLDELVLSVFPDCVSIAQIFGGYGEAAFREAEVSALVDVLAENRGAIIALGGGTPTAPGAAEILERHTRDGSASIVYLRCAPGALRARLIEAREPRDDRPSLTGDDPLAEIETIFAQRDELYRDLATRTLEDQASVDQALESLDDWLSW